ncbi:hypothetical protein [Nocardia brasiliensis]
MDAAPYEDPDPALREGVTAIADPSLRAAFRHPEDERGRFARLAEVIKNIVGEDRWQRDPNAETIRVLRRAITALPNSFSGRSPDTPQLSKDGKSAWRGLPEREYAEILYGFRDAEILQLRGLKPDDPDFRIKLRYGGDYRPEVFRRESEHGVNKRTAQRSLTVIWQDLTQVLLDMEARALEAAAQHLELADSETKYSVSRPALHDSLDTALNSGRMLTWVYGAIGSGKSSAVEKLLPKNSGDAFWIDCAEDALSDIMYGQIQEMLEKYGICLGGDNRVLRRRLIQLLCSTESPNCVVIDNYRVDLFPELSSVHPFKANVVVLSRYPMPEGLNGDVVTVEDLTDAEAAALIQHFLPYATEEESANLQKSTFRRVLILNQACRIICESDGKVTLAGYLEQIQNSSQLIRIIDSESDDFNRSLSAHFAFIRRQLEVRGYLSPVLRLILTCEPYPTVSLIEFLYSAITNDTSTPCEIDDEMNIAAHQEVRRALRIFTALGLMEIGQDPFAEQIDLPVFSPTIYIHPLTEIALDHAFSVDLGSEFDQIHQGLDRMAKRRNWINFRSAAILDDLFYLIIGSAVQEECAKRGKAAGKLLVDCLFVLRHLLYT